ncbi:hypothetical protein FCR2A7T_21080 [Flavobacterium cauense R2A-7]|uniref:Putative membrane protein n=1 Tax=Flavobacterium cauense R2A-7 TaxID=1341154 RepID=V6RW43_9FLAO|nr:DUF1003 domain-containing protein [Flavobacterium cauense]ESU18706.1 hypothetical protein FCR2A7T_21080 [Flavobacterium cauense R2A-7]KGO81818.1 hypothetical protein Q762_08225 [Flavobacterium cauense R2A-7]TWI13851.1 putative membrane protein [Flavobacterium cauense R2A-7]
MKTFVSDISGQEFPMADCVYGKMIRKSIFDSIKKEHPEFNLDSLLSISELNYFREKYISGFLLKEASELNELEKTVIKSLKNKQSVLPQYEDDASQITFGQRVADKVAEFGGSWTFIISFMFFLVVWICLNAFILMNKGFDPYPFILLNLILSCIAALQAPVIMMSQNRQEEKDRQRSKNDYMVNLKSELEIRMLHEKIDHLIMHQEQSLIELQKVQIDMMNDIINRIEKK